MHDVGDPLQGRKKTLRSCHIVGTMQRRSLVLTFTIPTGKVGSQFPAPWALQYPCQGQRGGESAFVQVQELELAGAGFFLSSRNSARAAATRSGSCLCRRQDLVR